ncbi:hypothetical protein [Cellulomonas wangsupingiae]|uniref:YtxH domain-containing protein n=1 Tax=Cellulomonas wangsupingiae TaxID=2968085 RepID=A0ABY5K4V6_9CELL|nr:hypothetical protein [Cellulomonas wangsupingiae]MCC2336072.1 hypothetical protein [Cellulomonas wangsupingiae]MCM0639618.1 hypothetical protein [Cellulomonas wangsupingiae]UUI64794.1 hypothetical protein NP075_17035 [Cellulomonas wangsupingiae]
MATVADRRYPVPQRRGAAHHARDPAWVRPPHHTRPARRARAMRHASAHGGRHLLRDVTLALLTLALAGGVVVGILHLDPALRDEVLDLLRQAEAAVRARVDALRPT